MSNLKRMVVWCRRCDEERQSESKTLEAFMNDAGEFFELHKNCKEKVK